MVLIVLSPNHIIYLNFFCPPFCCPEPTSWARVSPDTTKPPHKQGSGVGINSPDCVRPPSMADHPTPPQGKRGLFYVRMACKAITWLWPRLAATIIQPTLLCQSLIRPDL